MCKCPVFALLVLFFLFPAGKVCAADAAAGAPVTEGRTTVTRAVKASDMIDPSSFYVNEELFVSSIPILVLELEGGDALGPDLTARLTLYNKNDGDNSLADVPASTAMVHLQERRDYSTRGKFTYSVMLASADSTEAADVVSLAGLPPGKEWLLRGSVHDKVMLRNGLAYMLGQRLLPAATPEMRFCEVLFLYNGAYRYEGVHILAESMGDIYRKLAAPGKDGILLRYAADRARQADNAVRVGNKFFLATRIGSDEALTRDDKRDIAVELEKLESVLRSVSPSAFLGYTQQLDEQSAFGFFLLNSVMMNVLGDTVPFALLKNKDGKFQFIPDWDFDNSIDNAPERLRPLPYERGKVVVETQSILARRPPVWTILEEGGSMRDLRMYPLFRALEGEKFLWADSLFLSRSYLSGLNAAFASCREKYFSTRSLRGIVDVLTVRLGHAVERDWLRWEREYAGASEKSELFPFRDAKGVTHTRQTASFDQERVKISYNLEKQVEFLGEQIEPLYRMSSDLYDRGKSGNRQAGYSIITLVVIAFIIYLLTRRM